VAVNLGTAPQNHLLLVVELIAGLGRPEVMEKAVCRAGVAAGGGRAGQGVIGGD